MMKNYSKLFQNLLKKIKNFPRLFLSELKIVKVTNPIPGKNYYNEDDV